MPTAYRLLATLAEAGYVQQGPAGEWLVGVRAFRVGAAFLDHRNLVVQAYPFLKRLMEPSGETTNLAVIDQGEAVFVEQVQCRELMRMSTKLGARAPLHASGVGKAMLAAMDAARDRRGAGSPRSSRGTPRIRSPTARRWRANSRVRASAATRIDDRGARRGPVLRRARPLGRERRALGGDLARRPDVAHHPARVPEDWASSCDRRPTTSPPRWAATPRAPRAG